MQMQEACSISYVPDQLTKKISLGAGLHYLIVRGSKKTSPLLSLPKHEFSPVNDLDAIHLPLLQMRERSFSKVAALIRREFWPAASYHWLTFMISPGKYM